MKSAHTLCLAFGLAALLGGCASNNGENSTQAYAQKARGEPPQLQQIGRRWEADLGKGMAMLIVPIPKRMMGQNVGSFDYGMAGRLTAQNVWRNQKGEHTPMAPMEVLSNTYARQRYQVMLVPAGTYELTDIFAEMPDNQFDDPLATKQPKVREIGWVELSAGKTSDLVTGRVWREPQYEQREQDRWICDWVVGGTTQCVSGHYVRDRYEVKVREGRYDQVPQIVNNVNALAVHVRLRKPLARVTLKPGEVVLTDGMVYRQPRFFGFGNRACMASSAQTIRCELNTIEGQYYPGDLAQFRSEPLRMTESTMQALLLAQGVSIDPSQRLGAGDALMGMMLDGPVSAFMAAVLQRAEYRPATLLAPVDAKGVNDVGARSLAVRLQPKTVD